MLKNFILYVVRTISTYFTFVRSKKKTKKKNSLLERKEGQRKGMIVKKMEKKLVFFLLE